MIRPGEVLTITADTRLEPGTYLVPKGVSIAADNVTLDGNGATLIGDGRNQTGIAVNGRKNVTIRNVTLREYKHGIVVRDSRGVGLTNNRISATGEVPANTIFLDIWLPGEKAYGCAILLERVEDAEVCDNDIQHQQNGLLTYHCNKLTIRGNLANYNSGFGIHLFNTSDSVFEGNFCDFCCRYEARDESPAAVRANEAHGHMGGDATGFLIVHNSCRNVFRGNYARLGGDGFFLAGRTPGNAAAGCDDNLFENNDASLSPNIAFEATFSTGNRFLNNRADRCNYGFWLGFSSENTLEGNCCIMNRQAGVACENGRALVVRGNDFQRNGTGILLWSKYVEPWFADLPENRTIHHWTIEGNTLTRNGTGLSLAADRDHGIRPMPAEVSGKPELRPHDNSIIGNDIQDNRVGVHLAAADRTYIEKNTISRNVEANVRRDDAGETMLRNNLGLAGGYL